MRGPSVSQNWTLILKLRGNIVLESDLQLAEKEIAKLLGYPPEPLDRSVWEALVSARVLRPADMRYCRSQGVVGYRVRTETPDLLNLFQRLTFVELVVGETSLPREYWGKVMRVFERVPAGFIRLELGESEIRFRLVPFNAAAEWSDIIAKSATGPEEAVRALKQTLKLVVEGEMLDRKDMLSERALSAKLTTGHLFHGLHIYKAKFFPRFVRAILNIYAPHPGAYVLDPYVGSGTTLVESSVMGMPSVGVDIDPLSVLISKAKVKLLHATGEEVIESVLEAKARLEAVYSGQLSPLHVHEQPVVYSLIPSFLSRRIPSETQKEIAEDIALALSVLNSFQNEATLPLQVALSDAISRKLKFRFLGLGYERFSLNISRGRIIDMFRNNLEYLAKSIAVWHWLRNAANPKLALSEVRLNDARSLPFEEEQFDLIATSPPYMPASSGRENYLKSKALAMTALGLIEPSEIDSYEKQLVGSVHRSGASEGLPPKARNIVAWMASDEVRRVKANATASYFIDLGQSLREIRRLLRPGGRCVMVIARQHTFYRYKSREVVRVIDNVDVISELAEVNGLEAEEAVHIELSKRNAVARPRSLDAYYETALVFKKR